MQAAERGLSCDIRDSAVGDTGGCCAMQCARRTRSVAEGVVSPHEVARTLTLTWLDGSKSRTVSMW
jgi:hypothetical protein